MPKIDNLPKWEQIDERTHHLRLPALIIKLVELEDNQYFSSTDSIWEYLNYSDHQFFRLKSKSLKDAKTEVMQVLMKELARISNALTINARSLDIMLDEQNGIDCPNPEAVLQFKKDHLFDDVEYSALDISRMLEQGDK